MREGAGTTTAAEGGLVYGLDVGPGISRRRKGRRVVFVSPAGREIRDPQTLARIRSLAIPPAWEQVWISPRANQHLQATGRDAKGANNTDTIRSGGKGATRPSSTS